MSIRTLTVPESELLTWPMPDSESVQPKHREAFERRVHALRAVAAGATARAAAAMYKVDRQTVTDMHAEAPMLAEDGKPKGFRVCIPYFRHGTSAQPNRAEVPTQSQPHAFTQLLSILPEVAALVNSYKGSLPVRNVRCAAFETLFRKFKAMLKERGLSQVYPLNSPDKGRRALLKWIKRQRVYWLAAELATAEEEESVPAFAKHMANRPMDRVEFDAHKTDVKWHALVPLASGGWVTKLISHIWILIIVDCASRAIVAWSLVVGPNYSRFDVLRTFAKALAPWHPTTPLHPDLKYAPGAWMPSMVDTPDAVPRPALIAMDNHLGHISQMATKNLGANQQGVVNLGPAGVPEARPIIEALNKRMEDMCFRFIAGGFKPSRRLGEDAKATTKLDPSDHPVDLQLLINTLDIWVSTYNITPQDDLDERSPKDIFDAHVANGGWLSISTLTPEDEKDLLTIRIKPTLRASNAEGGLPVINWANARYRSSKLKHRTDLIGKSYKATVPADDIRKMSLWDEDGNLLVILHAQPPYADSPHTLEIRRRVERGKANGLYQVPAGADAIAIYNTFVRGRAAELQWATDEFVRSGMLDMPTSKATLRPIARSEKSGDTFYGLRPLAGAVTLTSAKSNQKP